MTIIKPDHHKSYFFYASAGTGIRLLILLTVFLFLSVSAFAQSFKPEWVNDIGGTGDSKATNIALDNNGNIYISGYIRGTATFNLKQGGTRQLTANGDADIYIAKYDIAAGNYLWALSVGAGGIDLPNSMAVDNAGNVIITGQFQSSVNFNPKGSNILTSAGGDDIFIAKYTSAGDFVWANSFGGSDIDRGHYITTDNENNVFLTASYTSAIDVDPSTGTNLLPDQGALSCFFAKYDAGGNFKWAHALGAVNQQNLTAVSIDKATDDVVIAGDFQNRVDFSYAGQPAATFTSDRIAGFVAKYDNNGVYKWVNYLPGSGSSILSSVKVDHQSNIIVTGNFGGQLTANGSSGTALNAKGNNDIFLASYSSSGALKWAQNFGNPGTDATSRYVTVDPNNNIFITGYFTGNIVFDSALPGGTISNTTGGRSIMLAGFNTLGKTLAAGAIGTSCTANYGYEIAADANFIYSCGSFCSTADFNTSTCDADNLIAVNGESDSFLAKFSLVASSGALITAFTIPQQTAPAVIDQAAHTITLTVAANTNVTALTPKITTSGDASISPASGTVENFTSPVTYTVTSACGTLQYVVTVTTTQTVTPVTVCLGVKHTLAGDKPQPLPDSYLWQQQQNGSWVNAPGNADAADYETAALPNTTGAALLYHLRRQTVTAGVVKYDSYYDVTVLPVTAITNNTLTPPATAAFCASGDPAPITGSTPAGGSGTYTYQWQSSADGVTFADITSAVKQDYDPPVLTVTTYFRRVVTSGSCTAPVVSNIVTISVIGPLANNVLNVPSPNTFCSPTNPGKLGGSDVTGGGNGLSYQWQSSTDGVSFTNVAGNFFNTYGPGVVSVTTYYRRLATSGPCATPLISNVIELIITDLPTNVVVDPAAAFICTGSTAKFTVNSPQTGVTYKWYDSQARTTLLFTGTVFSTPALTVNKTYYVEGVSGSCSSPALTAVSVTVSDIPAQPAIQASAAEVCAGSLVSLAIVNPQSGITYNWYASASATTPASTGPTFDIPAVTTTITYYAEAVNSTGCASATRAQVTVTANPVPVVTTTGVAVCPNSAATVTAATSDAGATIRWYAAAIGGTPLFTGANYSIANITAAVIYYAEAIDNATGCTSVRAAASITLIKQLDAPVVAVGETTVSSISFTWGKITGATGYEVSLDNGKTFTAPSSGSAGLSHTVSNLQLLQSVTIIVRATGNSDCQLSANSEAVTGKALSPYGNQIYVPNAFTPNGDGKNDIVYVHSESIQSLKFYVYDQWGELLYTSLSQQNGWDGSYKGAREPVGVYVYFLEAKMNDGQTVKKKGTITILR